MHSQQDFSRFSCRIGMQLPAYSGTLQSMQINPAAHPIQFWTMENVRFPHPWRLQAPLFKIALMDGEKTCFQAGFFFDLYSAEALRSKCTSHSKAYHSFHGSGWRSHLNSRFRDNVSSQVAQVAQHCSSLAWSVCIFLRSVQCKCMSTQPKLLQAAIGCSFPKAFKCFATSLLRAGSMPKLMQLSPSSEVRGLFPKSLGCWVHN